MAIRLGLFFRERVSAFTDSQRVPRFKTLKSIARFIGELVKFLVFEMYLNRSTIIAKNPSD